MHVLLLYPFAPNKMLRFYQVCRQRGWELTILTTPSSRCGFDVLKCNVVVTDEDTIGDEETIMRNLDDLSRFDVIVPFSEFSVVQAEKIAQLAGKRANSVHCLAGLRNKAEMRKVLAKAGIPQPETLAVLDATTPVSLEDFARFSYPVIAKPTDAAGSLHVKVCYNPQELMEQVEKIRTFQRWDDVQVTFSRQTIVEELMTGQEYSAEAIVQNGKILFLSNTHKLVSEWPYCDEIGHIVPAPLDETANAEIQKLVQKVVDGFGYSCGVLHVEFKHHRGEYRVVEIAFRLPGDRIPDLIELRTGVSLEEALIRSRMDEPLKITRKQTGCGPYVGVKFEFNGEVASRPTPGLRTLVVKSSFFQMTQNDEALENETVLTNRSGFTMFETSDFDALVEQIEHERYKVKRIAAEAVQPLRAEWELNWEAAQETELRANDAGATHFGLFHEKKLSGSVSVQIEATPSGKVGVIYSLVAEPELRQKGLTSALIQSVLDWLTTEGVTLVRGQATIRDLNNYQSLGFKQVVDNAPTKLTLVTLVSPVEKQLEQPHG